MDIRSIVLGFSNNDILVYHYVKSGFLQINWWWVSWSLYKIIRKNHLQFFNDLHYIYVQDLIHFMHLFICILIVCCPMQVIGHFTSINKLINIEHDEVNFRNKKKRTYL